MFNQGIFTPSTYMVGGFVGGSGTLNFVAKWTPNSVTIGDSQIYDDGTNVGVNISSSLGAKLHVKGAGATSATFAFRADSSSTANLFYVRNDGLVSSLGGYAIGGTQAFDINTTQANTAIGYTLMDVDNASANNNISLGTRIMTIATNATHCVGIGNDALFNHTSGDYCLAIGDSALGANTTGSKNVGVGYNTLSANVGGEENTGIGYNAGRGISSGDRHVAIGSESYGGGTGDDNVAVGYAAGSSAGNYSRSISLGSASNQTGAAYSDAIAIGYKSFNTAANQWIVGSNDSNINTTFFGRGISTAVASLGSFSLSVTGVSGSNVTGATPVTDGSAAASIFYIDQARGTGTGVPGVIIVRGAPAGSTGDAQNALVNMVKFNYDLRLMYKAPNSAPTDADLDNGMITAYLDQTAHELKFRVKYSDGTLKTGTVALV